MRSQIATSNGRGGRRYRPYMFTEQGIAMLSGVLRSNVAIQVSIRIMNTFVEMRRFIARRVLHLRKFLLLMTTIAENELYKKAFDTVKKSYESSKNVVYY